MGHGNKHITEPLTLIFSILTSLHVFYLLYQFVSGRLTTFDVSKHYLSRVSFTSSWAAATKSLGFNSCGNLTLVASCESSGLKPENRRSNHANASFCSGPGQWKKTGTRACLDTWSCFLQCSAYCLTPNNIPPRGGTSLPRVWLRIDHPSKTRTRRNETMDHSRLNYWPREKTAGVSTGSYPNNMATKRPCSLFSKLQDFSSCPGIGPPELDWLLKFVFLRPWASSFDGRARFEGHYGLVLPGLITRKRLLLILPFPSFLSLSLSLFFFSFPSFLDTRRFYPPHSLSIPLVVCLFTCWLFSVLFNSFYYNHQPRCVSTTSLPPSFLPQPALPLLKNVKRRSMFAAILYLLLF